MGLKESPISLIDLNTDEGVYVCNVFTDLDINESTFRIDQHVVWIRD